MLRRVDDTQFWNRIARKYASDPIKDMAGYERTLKRIEEVMQRHETWLEIGCGTGMTARRLAGFVKHLLATDASAEMIAIAREKQAAEVTPPPNLTFEVAVSDKVPSLEAGYDGALALNVLHLVLDRSVTLTHVHRALRPGALFVSKTPCLAEMNPVIRLAVPIAQTLGKAPSVSVLDGAQLERDITAAGFTIVESARHGSGRKDPRLFLIARK